MIDFRYHLVSLIAVFLAVALGIIIGTTALNAPILSDLERQVATLTSDKRSLEDQTRELQTQLDTDDAFEEAVGPVLVDGRLADASVLLVIADADVAPETVEGLSVLIGQANGTVAGTLRIQPDYSAPSTASSLQSFVSGPGMPPAGIQLPEANDPGRLVAALLAQVLMNSSDPEGTPPDGAATSSVLAGLTALDVLTQDSDSITPADYAIVLTAGVFDGEAAESRTKTLIDLVSALDAAGSGAVLAGVPATADEAGLVGVVRANPSLSAAISTVDNVGTAAGRISAVLALGAEGAGTSGKYGVGDGAQPVPPVPSLPAPTP